MYIDESIGINALHACLYMLTQIRVLVVDIVEITAADACDQCVCGVEGWGVRVIGGQCEILNLLYTHTCTRTHTHTHTHTHTYIYTHTYTVRDNACLTHTTIVIVALYV